MGHQGCNYIVICKIDDTDHLFASSGYVLLLLNFSFYRWTIVLIYLCQSFVRVFSHITRVGQQGKQCGLYLDYSNTNSLLFFTEVKSCSELLDPSFLFALDNGEKFSVQPMRFTTLLKMTRVKVSLIRMSLSYALHLFSFLLWKWLVLPVIQKSQLLDLSWIYMRFLCQVPNYQFSY